MAKFYFVLIGVIIMAVGVLVVRKFREPANRSAIGSFTILPLAGFAYLIAILCIISGSVFMLLGITHNAFGEAGNTLELTYTISEDGNRITMQRRYNQGRASENVFLLQR